MSRERTAERGYPKLSYRCQKDRDCLVRESGQDRVSTSAPFNLDATWRIHLAYSLPGMAVGKRYPPSEYTEVDLGTTG